MTLIWAQRTSPAFHQKVLKVSRGLGIDPSWLMACMAFETGTTFSPSIRNGAGSGATGLIQFMPATAKGLGTTTVALGKMDAVTQLDWVERYFKPWAGKLKSLEDTYMAILWPKAVGKPLTWALFDRASAPTAYRQNAGLDFNKDGQVTKAEAANKVREMYERGKQYAMDVPGGRDESRPYGDMPSQKAPAEAANPGQVASAWSNDFLRND